MSESDPATPADAKAVADAVARALAEDLGPEGDLTAALVPAGVTAHFALRARHHGRAGRAGVRDRGLPARRPRASSSSGTRTTATTWRPATPCMEVTGALRPILTAERTALNFLGHLSGIATLTARFVAAAHESNPSVQVLDTRKTTPGLRARSRRRRCAPAAARATGPACPTPCS